MSCIYVYVYTIYTWPLDRGCKGRQTVVIYAAVSASASVDVVVFCVLYTKSRVQ